MWKAYILWDLNNKSIYSIDQVLENSANKSLRKPDYKESEK